MNRKIHLFIVKVAVALLALPVSYALPTPGQSQARQQTKPIQSSSQADNSDDDLINPDRPGIADGSAVIGPKKIQVESGFQEEFRRQENTREHTLFFPTLLRIGITSRCEARIESNTFTRTSDFDSSNITHHASGLAPFSLGIKYQIEDSKGLKHPSVGAIARIFPDWGTSVFRTHHVTGDLRLAADWDFAPKMKLSLNPNAGIGVYEDDQGREFTAKLLAATLNYLPSKRLNPFIDFGLQAPEEKKGNSSVIVDAGVAYIIGRNLQLDASVGAGAHGNTPPHPFVSFGVSFRSNFVRHGK